MKLTIYVDTAIPYRVVYEIQADTFQATDAASRAIVSTMTNEEKMKLLSRGWFFLRTDEGMTISEGRVCESKELLP